MDKRIITASLLNQSIEYIFSSFFNHQTEFINLNNYNETLNNNLINGKGLLKYSYKENNNIFFILEIKTNSKNSFF